MSDQQRLRIVVWRTMVKEMNVEAVNLRNELFEAIQGCLARPPVVVMGPIPAKASQPLERHALAPVVDDFRLWPASGV